LGISNNIWTFFGQELFPHGDGTLGKLENVILLLTGVHVKTMRSGSLSELDLHIVPGDCRRLVAGAGTCKYEMLRSIRKIGADPKHWALVDQRLYSGPIYTARLIVHKPVFEVMNRLKERQSRVERLVGAAWSPGVHATHTIQAAKNALPL
jgi:hypothetical protein